MDTSKVMSTRFPHQECGGNHSFSSATMNQPESTENKTEHKHGVGILLTMKVAKSWMGFHAVSDKVLIVKLASKPLNIVIIQVYALTGS